MSNNVLIETVDLCKSYGKRQIIKNLDMKVEVGDIYGFLGPNGSGKTTTIRMLLGLVHPTSGQVILNGFNVKDNVEAAVAEVGAIVENPSFYNYLSGRDNLKLMANLYPGLLKKRVEEVLDIVKLKDRAKDKVGTYSLGMKQRLGIAMALLNNPKLIILDEPTNGLDPQGMKDIKELILKLAKEQKITFFISSHLLHEVEQICTKVGVLKEGELLAEGNVQELLSTQHEVFEVNTTETAKAMEVLKQAEFVKAVKPSEKGVIVETEKGSFAKLNQLLIINGVEVSLLNQQGNSLETFFFNLTGGAEKSA